MSTRAQVRFATRGGGVSFSEHPENINAQFYVHYDGYPEGLGVDIAESFVNDQKIAGWEIEALNAKHGDLEYIYYVWQDPIYPWRRAWISIFALDFGDTSGKCIFVGTPSNLIDRYKTNTNAYG